MAEATPPRLPPQPWGYFVTLAWALLAVVASTLVGIAAIATFFPERFAAVDLDVTVVGVVSIGAFAAEIAVLALAARLARWPVADYLGLTVPNRREVAIGFGSVIALVLILDATTYLLGREVVTQFQIDLYRNAGNAGTLCMLVVAVVIVAPAGEEIMFRGFLFRGWAREPRSIKPAIVVISVAWAGLHTQYDWYGMLYIFVLGLLLGWVRWRSNSTLLTMGLHALVNAWATAQTFIVIRWGA